MAEKDDNELFTDAVFIEALEKHSRGWLGYWAWSDKPVMERNAAHSVLSESGFNIQGLRSRNAGEDPPDCEAYIDGQWCGIEVTELIHRSTLQRSLKAKRLRESGVEPEKAEAYFAYERDDLLRELQARIDAKDAPAKIKGGPYERYILVIVTDEFFLYEEAVSTFLTGATFRASLITDVFLGLSYHPSEAPEEGRCPVFQLPLVCK